MLFDFVIIIFIFYQIVLIVTVYIILSNYELIPTEAQTLFSTKDFVIPVICNCYSFITRVCFQPVVICFCYLLMLFINPDTKYSEYKQIPSQLMVTSSTNHIILFVLITVCLFENVILWLCRIFFFTDLTFLRIYIWATSDWQPALFDLIFKTFLSAIFILDSNDTAITATSLIASLGYLILIFLRFYKTVSAYLLADLIELFYECLVLLLYMFIVIDQVFFINLIKNSSLDFLKTSIKV